MEIAARGSFSNHSAAQGSKLRSAAYRSRSNHQVSIPLYPKTDRDQHLLMGCPTPPRWTSTFSGRECLATSTLDALAPAARLFTKKIAAVTRSTRSCVSNHRIDSPRFFNKGIGSEPDSNVRLASDRLTAMRCPRPAPAVALLVLWSILASAQSDTASISGRITDQVVRC
jgi:hypothetical protein